MGHMYALSQKIKVRIAYHELYSRRIDLMHNYFSDNKPLSVQYEDIALSSEIIKPFIA